MTRFHRSLTWLLATGYALVAVVVGGGHPYLHNHSRAGAGVCSESGHGHHHGHHHGHDASDADHRDHHALQPSCPTGHQEQDGDCVVCQYLAQQPLPVVIQTTPGLSEWRRPLFVSAQSQAVPAPQFTHPARGPPQCA
jgi:hypothetical protein